MSPLEDRTTVKEIEKAFEDKRGYEGRSAVPIAAYHPDQAVRETLINYIKNQESPYRDAAAQCVIYALRNNFVKPPDD